MAKLTKSERADYCARLREALEPCGPSGKGTLLVQWVGGGPSSAGRSDYFELRVMAVDEDGRPHLTSWLNRLVCGALGYRFNAAREAVMLGGCGYSKSHALCQHLADFAGFELYVQASDCERVFKPSRTGGAS